MCSRLEEDNAGTLAQAIRDFRETISAVMPSMEETRPQDRDQCSKEPNLHGYLPPYGREPAEARGIDAASWDPLGVQMLPPTWSPCLMSKGRQIGELFKRFGSSSRASGVLMQHTWNSVQNTDIKTTCLITQGKCEAFRFSLMQCLDGLRNQREGWQKINLPEDKNKQIKLTMTPSSNKRETVNGKTKQPKKTAGWHIHLPRVLKRFGEGATQRELQQEYQVRPKQLALCITGCKYLGGTDWKALAKKCKRPQMMSQNYQLQRRPPLNKAAKNSLFCQIMCHHTLPGEWWVAGSGEDAHHLPHLIIPTKKWHLISPSSFVLLSTTVLQDTSPFLYRRHQNRNSYFTTSPCNHL